MPPPQGSPHLSAARDPLGPFRRDRFFRRSAVGWDPPAKMSVEVFRLDPLSASAPTPRFPSPGLTPARRDPGSAPPPPASSFVVGAGTLSLLSFPFSTPPTAYLPPDSAVKGEGYVCAACQESPCQHVGGRSRCCRAGTARSSAVYLFAPSVSPWVESPRAGLEDQSLPDRAGGHSDSQELKMHGFGKAVHPPGCVITSSLPLIWLCAVITRVLSNRLAARPREIPSGDAIGQNNSTCFPLNKSSVCRRSSA